MAARDKPAMKVSLSRSRFPVFLFITLVFIVLVLLYYYWNLSSSNQVLLRELKILERGKLETEKRRSALESQVFEIENERRLAEEALEKERSTRLENERTANKVSSDLHEQLQITREQLYTAEENEKNYRKGLETLKKGVNSSSLDLQKLKGRAAELLTKYKELKDSHASLLLKVTNLTSERDVCQEELVKVKMDLDQQKKTQEAKVEPSDTNALNKRDDEKKVTDEGQSVDEGSDKDTNKSKKEDKNEDTKKPEKDDENKDDENAESPKEEKEKESVEVTKPVPSKASANQNNASVSTSVPQKIKPDGNKSQNEETDKGNQGNPDNSEEVEKETGKDEESYEQQTEDDSPKEKKDMDSQPVPTSDQNNRENENRNEGNEEDEGEEEESDDDLDTGGRLERSTKLAADMRRRMQPLPGDNLEKETRIEQPVDNMDEIRKLQRNPMNAQGVMPRKINPLDTPSKVEKMRKRKKAEDQDQ